MKIGPNQVHMAPFGLVLSQNGSYRVWDASGMRPAPQNPPKNPRNAAGVPEGQITLVLSIRVLSLSRVSLQVLLLPAQLVDVTTAPEGASWLYGVRARLAKDHVCMP